MQHSHSCSSDCRNIDVCSEVIGVLGALSGDLSYKSALRPHQHNEHAKLTLDAEPRSCFTSLEGVLFNPGKLELWEVSVLEGVRKDAGIEAKAPFNDCGMEFCASELFDWFKDEVC